MEEKKKKEIKKPKKVSEKDKAEKSAGWIIGVVLLAIVLVIVVFVIRQTFFGPTFEYKGYKVTRVIPEGTTATLYVLRAPVRIYGSTNIYYLNLYNDPRELEDIKVENTTREVLLDPKPQKVYVAFDPEMPNQGYVAVATTSIARIMGANGVFRLPVSGAVTKQVEGLEEKFITCDNSDESTLVINLMYANETKIYVDESYWRCVIVQGKDEQDIIRAADKVILTLLGI